MSFFWLRHHVIEINFEFNIFIMFSFFCFVHCCSFLVKIYNIIREEKEFLSLKKSQRIWEFENQKNQFNFNYVISFNLVSIVHQKQLNFQLVRKKQFARKKQLNISIVHKKQFNFQFVQKKTIDSQKTTQFLTRSKKTIRLQKATQYFNRSQKTFQFSIRSKKTTRSQKTTQFLTRSKKTIRSQKTIQSFNHSKKILNNLIFSKKQFCSIISIVLKK